MTSIELVRDDITRQQVDAIVNAANSSLLGGGGVDGAIHRVGGPEILAECERLRLKRYPDGLPVGDAVATTAGRLPAGHVIHAVGPVFNLREDRTPLLSSAYRRSLEIADDLGAVSVAFPALSAGAYRWPLDDAARIAISAVRGHHSRSITLVRFVLFSDAAYAAFERAYQESSAPGPR